MNTDQESNSPTPRTAAITKKLWRSDQHWLEVANDMALHSAQLETELNESNTRLSKLEKSHLNLKAFLDDVESVKQGVENERDEWRYCAQELAKQVPRGSREEIAALDRFYELSKQK